MGLDRHGFLLALALFAAAILAVGAWYVVRARQPLASPFEGQHVAGDVPAGHAAIVRFGCGACHRVPGVERAHGRVAPALDDLRNQRYLAGRIPNTPENLVRFIMEPQAISPGSAMPNMGVTEIEARNIVAYLFSVRQRR